MANVMTVKIIGVRFKKAGKIYYFSPGGLTFSFGDGVVVETARGIEFGTVAVGDKEIPEKELPGILKPVLRKATEDDIQRHENNKALEKAALALCRQKALEHKLPIKPVDVSCIFDNSKMIFYFTSEGRVDFRDLVRDLATVYRTRIELRQIGVRDEAKILGGLGPCGRDLCCASVLGDFHPVSIKMAKKQNLSLNPGKISGLCGRLMCCLKYEYYEEDGRRGRRKCAYMPEDETREIAEIAAVAEADDL